MHNDGNNAIWFSQNVQQSTTCNENPTIPPLPNNLLLILQYVAQNNVTTTFNQLGCGAPSC